MTDNMPLLPCPFCDAAQGNNGVCDHSEAGHWFIVCWACGMSGPAGNSFEKAAKLWNTRAVSQPTDMEKVRELLRNADGDTVWDDINEALAILDQQKPATPEMTDKLGVITAERARQAVHNLCNMAKCYWRKSGMHENDIEAALADVEFQADTINAIIKAVK